MIFFGLLYLAKNRKAMINSSVGKFDDQIICYLKCASVLNESLLSQGYKFELLTNNKTKLHEILNSNNLAMTIREIPFQLNVPDGINFYSAHFKIDAFCYLSKLSYTYMALIDLDIICLNEMPPSLSNCITYGFPIYYDISDQVFPAYGALKILDSMKIIDNDAFVGVWAGGEFLSGTANFFRDLYNEIQRIGPKYFSNWKHVHHQGDEILTSIALENLKRKKSWNIVNGGTLGIIGRYWSVDTLHIQKNISSYYDNFLLHLPADKKFLSELTHQNISKKIFIEKYEKYLFQKALNVNLPIYRRIIIMLSKIIRIF